MRTLRRISATVGAMAMALALVPLSTAQATDQHTTTARASGHTHHVSCEARPGGTGSVGRPYASLEELEAAEPFGPGDQILFRKGTICDGAFAPTDSGTASAPITVSSYGAGKKLPTINGNGARAALNFTDVDHWTVDGMRVINPGDSTQRRSGILFEITDGKVHSGVKITNSHVEDVAAWSDKRTNAQDYVQSAGILVRGDGVGAYEGISITGNEINDAGAGGIKLSAPDTTKIRNTDVLVSHNDIHEVGGDGIVIHNSDSPLIEHNEALNLGHGKYPFLGGNFAGMWPYNSADPTFQYNVVGNSVASTYDSTAWDCDMKIEGTCLFQYNYSYGNAGGFYLDCISGCGDASTKANTVLRYNVSQDDCRIAGESGGPGRHKIYNNTFYCPSRDFEDDMTAPKDFANNLVVAPGGKLKEQDADFSSNAYYGGIEAPGSEKDAIVSDTADQKAPGLVAGGSGQTTRDLPGYALQSSSPLIGAGTTVEDDGGQDFFGEPIPSTPNIGAYQGAGRTNPTQDFGALVNRTSVASPANPLSGAVGGSLSTFSSATLETAGLKVAEPAVIGRAKVDWHPNAVGTPDTVRATGQSVRPSGHGRHLLIMGYTSGKSTGGHATVHYRNGSVETVRLDLKPWDSASKEATSRAETTAEEPFTVATANGHFTRDKPYLGGTVSTKDAPVTVSAQRIKLSRSDAVSITLPDGSVTGSDGLNLFGLQLSATRK